MAFPNLLSSATYFPDLYPSALSPLVLSNLVQPIIPLIYVSFLSSASRHAQSPLPALARCHRNNAEVYAVRPTNAPTRHEHSVEAVPLANLLAHTHWTHSRKNCSLPHEGWAMPLYVCCNLGAAPHLQFSLPCFLYILTKYTLSNHTHSPNWFLNPLDYSLINCSSLLQWNMYARDSSLHDVWISWTFST